MRVYGHILWLYYLKVVGGFQSEFGGLLFIRDFSMSLSSEKARKCFWLIQELGEFVYKMSLYRLSNQSNNQIRI